VHFPEPVSVVFRNKATLGNYKEGGRGSGESIAASRRKKRFVLECKNPEPKRGGNVKKIFTPKTACRVHGVGTVRNVGE